MKRLMVVFSILGMMCSTPVLAYMATQKGVVVEAKDCGRMRNDLCLEAPVSELVQKYIGKGIPASVFMNTGVRPVSVSITNTTDKPMILASYYGMKAINAKGMVDALTHSMIAPKISNFGFWGGMSGQLTIYLGLAAFFVRRGEEQLTLGILAASAGAGIIACAGYSVFLSYLAKQFSGAMAEKFEELNHKNETLILPGKTVKKLLIAQNEAYISRFPLVVYPLENRQDAILFDVDLRA